MRRTWVAASTTRDSGGTSLPKRCPSFFPRRGWTARALDWTSFLDSSAAFRDGGVEASPLLRPRSSVRCSADSVEGVECLGDRRLVLIERLLQPTVDLRTNPPFDAKAPDGPGSVTPVTARRYASGRSTSNGIGPDLASVPMVTWPDLHEQGIGSVSFQRFGSRSMPSRRRPSLRKPPLSIVVRIDKAPAATTSERGRLGGPLRASRAAEVGSADPLTRSASMFRFQTWFGLGILSLLVVGCSSEAPVDEERAGSTSAIRTTGDQAEREDPKSESASDENEPRVAYAYSCGPRVGQRCFTRFGWCPATPACISSVCFCGQTQGFMAY